MSSCFICLNVAGDDTPLIKLCGTCADSTICQPCLQSTLANETHQTILMNCPLCRRPTNLNRKVSLSVVWHCIIAFFWICADYNIPLWMQTLLLSGSYRYMEEVCRKVNHEKDNLNPRILRKRWTVWTNLTFVPYTVFLWLYPAGFSMATNITVFTAGHIIFPVSASILLYIINLAVVILNRYFSV